MWNELRKFVAQLTPWQRGLDATLLNAAIWCLYYHVLAWTRLPEGWTLEAATIAAVTVAAAGGMLCRVTSRRLWPILVGAGIGVVLGAEQTYFTDVVTSFWQRVYQGLTVNGRLPFYLWTAIVVGWAGTNAILGMGRSGVALRRRGAAEVGAGATPAGPPW